MAELASEHPSGSSKDINAGRTPSIIGESYRRVIDRAAGHAHGDRNGYARPLRGREGPASATFANAKDPDAGAVLLTTQDAVRGLQGGATSLPSDGARVRKPADLRP